MKRANPGSDEAKTQQAQTLSPEEARRNEAETLARRPQDPVVTKIASIAPGDERCPQGGVSMTSFQDSNKDGVYDASEDKDFKESTACAAPKERHVIRQTSLAPGDTSCPAGGTRVETFHDVNGNSIFDAGIDANAQTVFVCNGAAGKTGDVGAQGIAGRAGTDGVSLAVRKIGTGDAHCSAGGFEVTEYVDLDTTRGFDAQKDSFLRAEKICLNPNTSFETRAVEVGDEECAAGGVEVRTWRDLDADGIFDGGQESLDQARKVCHGVKGETGFNAVVQVEDLLPGSASCANGGYRVKTFTDSNFDNAFGPEDLNSNVRDVCHGSHAMWVTENIPVGDARCADGGVQFKPFVDLNNSRKFDVGDIRLAEYKLCNGRNIAGYNAVIAQETLVAGDSDCPEGGYRIRSSTDVNKNGLPDIQDFNFTVRKVCQGQATNTTQTPPADVTPTPEPGTFLTVVQQIPLEDATCFLGGKKTITAQDANADGILQESDASYLERVECESAQGTEHLVMEKTFPADAGTVPGCARVSYPRSAAVNANGQAPAAVLLDAAVEVCNTPLARADIPAPPPAVLPGRFLHGALFAENRLLVWGGRDFSATAARNDGAVFDPSSGTWSSISKMNAPSARFGHVSVWTGARMIVFGGADGKGVPQWSGKRYDPATDTWANMSSPPAGSENRSHFSWTWTGSEFVIWGGSRFVDGGSERNDGVAYNPENDTWRKLVQPPPPGTPTPFPTVANPAETPVAIATPTPIPPLPGSRHWAPMGHCGGQLALTGGRTTSKNSAEIVTNQNYQWSTFTYSESDDFWQRRSDIPEQDRGVAGAGEACLSGHWIVQGGVRANPGNVASWFGLPSPWLRRFQVAAHTWLDRVATPFHLVGNGPTFAEESANRVVVTLSDAVFGVPSHVATYTPDSNVWRLSEPLSGSDKRAGASSVYANGKMWVWGGLDSNNTPVATGYTLAP